MKSILDNPYRIAGLLAGSSTREAKAKIKKFRRYVGAGETPPAGSDDYSLPVLGQLTLTEELLNETESKLDLDGDKLEAALFWFYNANFKDEAALDALREGEVEKALQLWQKSSSSGVIGENNWSAFHNLSTLYLWESTNKFRDRGLGTAVQCLEKGLSMKIAFLESKYAEKFLSLVVDKTYSIKPVEVEKIFLQTVKKEIGQSKTVAAAEMISVLSKMTFAAKDEFLKGFTQTFASEIERHVEATAKKRQADPLKAVSAGTELIKNVADQLKNLKEARGKNDLMYTSVADKVASELLECAIVNYNEYQSRVHKGVEQSLPRIVEIIERKSTPSAAYARRILNEARPYLSQLKAATETDAKKIAYSSSAMEKLLKKGQSLAVGMMVINRYEKNAPGILKGVDTQDIYLVMSSRLASSAEKMCVDEVNACIARGLGSIENLRRLGETMTESLEVYAMIEKMDLMQEFRTALDTRKQQLSEMYDKIPPLPNFGREPQRQKTVDDMKEREELRARFYQSGDDGERAARERAAIKRWKEERAAKRSKAILWTFIIVGMVVGGYYMGVSAGRYAAGALGGGAAGWLAAVIINGIIKGITKN